MQGIIQQIVIVYFIFFTIKRWVIVGDIQFMPKHTFHILYKTFNIPVSIGLTPIAHMLDGYYVKYVSDFQYTKFDVLAVKIMFVLNDTSLQHI